jgi:hypothetical protein
LHRARPRQHQTPQPRDMEPLHITKFASERYFSKLGELNENADGESSSSALPKTVSATSTLLSSTFTLPLGTRRPPTPPEITPLGNSAAEKRSFGHDLASLRTQRRPTFSGSFGSLRSKISGAHKTPTIVEHQTRINPEDVHNLNKCV